MTYIQVCNTNHSGFKENQIQTNYKKRSDDYCWDNCLKIHVLKSGSFPGGFNYIQPIV